MDKQHINEWTRETASKPFCNGKLLPVARARAMGMRDFVMEFLCSGDRYIDCYEAVLDSSDLMLGGYLRYNPRRNGYYYLNVCCMEDDHWTYAEAAMEAYDKYLCSDGKIRYLKNDESDAEYKALCRKYDDEFWENINDAFVSMGMHYNEEEGCWINPETGETGCY